MDSTPHPVVDGPHTADAAVPAVDLPWTQRRVKHSWIVVAITSLLFAAAAVGLVLIIRNATLAILIGAATTTIGQR